MENFNIPDHWLNSSIKLALVGCGGTGSELADELYSMGFLMEKLSGHSFEMVLYDPDQVSEYNIGRQRFWPSDQGFNKAEVLAARYNSFGGTSWRYVSRHFMADDAQHFDLIITALDSAKTRCEIGEEWRGRSSRCLWLDCGNGKNSGNIILGHLGRSSGTGKLPNVYDLYGQSLAQIEDDLTDSCSHQAALSKQDFGVNKSAGREAANLLWQLVRHGKIKNHGVYYDLSESETQPLAIDSQVWAAFGYSGTH